MSKTILDDASIGASGNTTATFEKLRGDNVSLKATSSDDSGVDITVSLTGAKVASDESAFSTVSTTEEFKNVDSGGDGVVMRFVEVDGYESVEFTVTDNTATAIQVTLEAEGY